MRHTFMWLVTAYHIMLYFVHFQLFSDSPEDSYRKNHQNNDNNDNDDDDDVLSETNERWSRGKQKKKGKWLTPCFLHVRSNWRHNYTLKKLDFTVKYCKHGKMRGKFDSILPFVQKHITTVFFTLDSSCHCWLKWSKTWASGLRLN